MWNWFGGSQANKTAPVTLHVYDLGPTVAGVNAILGAVGTGAFHAGVEVYGTEWSFGCCCDGPYGSGIFCVPPKGCEAHVYREPVHMGETSLTKRQVDDLIDRLARQWHGSSYDLLRHNCCHFSDEFCKHLGVDPVPAWVLSLAGVGAMLRSAVRLGGGAVYGAANAVYEGAAYAAEIIPARRGSAGSAVPTPQPAQEAEEQRGGAAGAGRGGQEKERPQPQRPSPFACQMPPAEGRRLGEGLGGGGGGGGGGGLGAGLRAGLGGGLFQIRASLFDDEAPRKAAPSRGARKPSSAGADAQEGGADRLAVGDAVEVFSNSHGAWCLGRVEAVDGSGMATVTFRLPNAGPNELATKLLPLGHKHLRRAKAEAAKAAEAGAPLLTGDLVEIYSNSKQVWCPGYVESVYGRAVKVAFQLPGYAEGELAHKELPIDHKDIRRKGAEAADAGGAKVMRKAKTTEQMDEVSTAASSPEAAQPRGLGRRNTVQGFENDSAVSRATLLAGEAAGTEASRDGGVGTEVTSVDNQAYGVGEWVEVFTNTHQVWCLGRVTQADDSGKVHVVFQMPGAAADEWVVKRLQPGCKELRPAAVADSSSFPGPTEPAWTSEEETAYGQRFNALLTSARESNQVDGSLVADLALAEYLRGSGLPRRALKEIWQVANPVGKAMLGIAEFRICCRLVAHCQTRSWERADMLSAGGEPLRHLLEGELLQTPALKLAEFKGQ